MQIRIAKPEDVPELFEIRTSVRENLLTVEEMATLGITHAALTAMIVSGTARAWCVESDGQIVGFSMAEQNEREIFALFVLPEYEGRGFGSAFLGKAVNLTQTHIYDISISLFNVTSASIKLLNL